jgi:transcriptional regulator with XRE-family HTH domain
VQVNKAIDGSDITITDLSAMLQHEPPRNTLNRWLRGSGSPLLGPLDKLLNLIGYRFVIVETPTKAGQRLRDSTRDTRDRSKVRPEFKNRTLPDTVPPMMVEVYQFLEELNVNRVDLCRESGMSYTTIGHWLNGDSPPPLLMVDRFLNAAGYQLKVARGLLGPRRPAVPPAAAAE